MTYKEQPWKKHWPPPANVQEGFEVGKKAGDKLEIDGQGGNGTFGYTDEDPTPQQKDQIVNHRMDSN